MPKKQIRIKELEDLSQKQEFWDNPQVAGQLQKELSDLNQEKENLEKLNNEVKDLYELSGLAEGDEALQQEVQTKIDFIDKEINKEEFKTFLSGKYDQRNAILTISAGAGGDEAQDWASMLLRMYSRYAEKKGFDYQVIDVSYGEPSPQGNVGIKQATLEINGKYAYGFLRKEHGVHRLVRISPFSAQALRHTSFSMVEVMPEINRTDENINISDNDLRVETSRSGGAGGQNVNKRETAIRIVHIPTNIAVSCQTERTQLLNKEKALKMLYAKLYQIKEQEHLKEISDIQGAKVKIEWGNQIRSYVLQPYRMVKDLRTEYQTSDTEGVLDGKIDEFIEAEIKSKDI